MESQIQLNTEIILVVGSIGMLLLTTAITLFIFLFQRKLITRKLAYLKIEDLLKHQELKSAYALLEGQDMERQRIATELHDNLGTILVTLNMYVDTLLQEKNLIEQRKLVEIISRISQQACDDARKLSHRLDSGSLNHFGFKVAVDDLIQVINDTKYINAKWIFNCDNELRKELSFNLYRIIQELINNTLKHAHASEVNLEVSTVNNEYVSFIYEDNGLGITAPLEQQKGIGLKNIELRVEKLNGTLVLDRKRVNGFTMIIEIPL
jgi:two-component system, NarL family, sensor kinase